MLWCTCQSSSASTSRQLINVVEEMTRGSTSVNRGDAMCFEVRPISA